MLHIPTAVHAKASATTAAGKCLNAWAAEVLDRAALS